MQQLIVLADAYGVVDMTPQAISARTSIPLRIITKGLKLLSEPDPYTRTPGEEGRRIIALDAHRPWGWQLVNHAKYKALRDMEQKREVDRVRIAEKRKKNKHVAIGSQSVANVAHTDTDTNTPLPPKGGFVRFWLTYPKKRSKGRAEKAWRAINPDEPFASRIIAAVERAKTSDDWKREGGKYIPHPASWLNAKGWEDEFALQAPQRVAMP